jgi:hypothetical protein
VKHYAEIVWGYAPHYAPPPMSPHPQGGIFDAFYEGTDVSLDSRKNFHYFTEVVVHFIFIYVNKKFWKIRKKIF